jgi:hypothetical protein
MNIKIADICQEPDSGYQMFLKNFTLSKYEFSHDEDGQITPNITTNCWCVFWKSQQIINIVPRGDKYKYAMSINVNMYLYVPLDTEIIYSHKDIMKLVKDPTLLDYKQIMLAIESGYQ